MRVGSNSVSVRASALAAMLAAVGKMVMGALRHLRLRWQSSLQLRVVSTTLVVSAIVVSLLGFFLMQQITMNLLGHAEAVASNQAAEGLTYAEAQPVANGPPTIGTGQQLADVVGHLASTTSTTSSTVDYGVAIALPPDIPGYPAYLTSINHYFPGPLPAGLATQADRAGGSPLIFASLPYPKATSPKTTGVVYAHRFGDGYELYYFFPLTQLQNELSLIVKAMALVGLALVFLLAGIAWLVTRWVVVPVARAAHGAKSLSTGNLDERLSVRGSDELAALATSFNEMAASLQEKVGELEDLSRVQRQFVSDVSHELRTPLSTILMAADVLFEARQQLDFSAGRSAELLHGQLGRFESLLADLLEISRYDANAATLDAEPADLGDLVRHSADVAQQLAERRGARIEFKLPPEPCVAELDRKRVERILRNLLVNAVEHGEGHDVVVTCAGDRDAVAVAVRDFGVGLAPGQEHLVFDRFWRADPARARTTGGTGLGLAIALEDARLHGGWLEAWGEPGRGSVFRLTLPREAGIELAGSPLPLGPDRVYPDGLATQPRLEGAGSDGRGERRDDAARVAVADWADADERVGPADDPAAGAPDCDSPVHIADVASGPGREAL